MRNWAFLVLETLFWSVFLWIVCKMFDVSLICDGRLTLFLKCWFFANEILILVGWRFCHELFIPLSEIKGRFIVAVSIKLCCIRLHYLLSFSHYKYPIEVQWYRLKSDWKLIFLCFAMFALFCPHGLLLFLILETELKILMSTTGYPRSLQWRPEVTLGCKQCCVTNGYLQRVVWDVNGYF